MRLVPHMHMLSASRRLAARRPPALLSCRRSAFVGLDKPTDAASQEEVDHVALQLSRLLRALAIGWLGWKLYEIIVEGGNTYLIAPSLTLVRSRHADNRESGIWRVNNWHSSGAHRACNPLPSCSPLALLASNTVSTPVHVAAPALEVVLEQGGAEALLSALPSAQPATRSTIIELLTRMAPLGEPVALHALTTLRR